MGKIEMAAPNPLTCVEQKLARFVDEQPGTLWANYLYAIALWKGQEQLADERVVQRVESLLSQAVAIDAKCGDAYLHWEFSMPRKLTTRRRLASMEKQSKLVPS